MTAIRLTLILLCLAATVLAGCGGSGGSGGGDATSTPTATTEATVTATPTPDPPIDARFDVGGHKLHLRCAGTGGPTFVYLHPYVADETDRGGDLVNRVMPLLAEKHRVCTYDRANVGDSDEVDGIQTGEDSVRDLRRLLLAADVAGPYVLLGSGFGGLLADMYAASDPDEVAGMVLLDGDLPADLDIQERFLPEAQRLEPGDWRGTVERLDQLETFRQALKTVGEEPSVPVTYIGPKDLRLDPSLDTTRVTAVIRDSQQMYLDQFDPGRLVLLDTPLPMEPFAFQRIADEVERVVDEAREDAGKDGGDSG